MLMTSSDIIILPGLYFNPTVRAKETYGDLENLYLVSWGSLETPCRLEVYIMKYVTKKKVFIEFRRNKWIFFYVTFFPNTISRLIRSLSVTTMWNAIYETSRQENVRVGKKKDSWNARSLLNLYEQRIRSRGSDLATSWTARRLNPGRGKKFFLLQNRPYRRFGPIQAHF